MDLFLLLQVLKYFNLKTWAYSTLHLFGKRSNQKRPKRTKNDSLCAHIKVMNNNCNLYLYN